MPLTKHPVTGEYYNSKSAFRAVTKAHGYEEVGTAYEKGYDPTPNSEKQIGELAKRLTQETARKLYGGWNSRRG